MASNRSFWDMIALIDIDDTITNSSECYPFGRTVTEEFLAKKLQVTVEEIHTARDESRKDVNTRGHGNSSSHSRHLYIEDAIRRVTWKHHVRLAQEAHELYRATVIPLMKLEPGVDDFFIFLKKNKTKIVLISDMTHDIQVKKLIHLKVVDTLDLLVTSEVAFCEKPDKGIFEYIFALVWETDPKKYFMVGDSLSRDITGAIAIGIPHENIRHKKKEWHESRTGDEKVNTFDDFGMIVLAMGA